MENHAAAEPHVHVVPLRLILGVGGLLIVLTAVTVGATWVDLGAMNIVVALAIAVAKATFVALYFMHLRWDKPLHAVAFLTALGCVVLFVLLAVMDTGQYHPDRIPGYAPGVHR